VRPRNTRENRIIGWLTPRAETSRRPPQESLFGHAVVDFAAVHAHCAVIEEDQPFEALEAPHIDHAGRIQKFRAGVRVDDDGGWVRRMWKRQVERLHLENREQIVGRERDGIHPKLGIV